MASEKNEKRYRKKGTLGSFRIAEQRITTTRKNDETLILSCEWVLSMKEDSIHAITSDEQLFEK